MRILIVSDFDDTLACMKGAQGAPEGLFDKEGSLTECQQFHVRKQKITVLTRPRSNAEPEETYHYPLGGGHMRDLIDALNDNSDLLSSCIFFVVITNGTYIPESVRDFFKLAYDASDAVVARIRVVSRANKSDRGMSFSGDRAGAIDEYLQKLNSGDNPMETSVQVAEQMKGLIAPEMVYLFDDQKPNLENALTKGFYAVDARSPLFCSTLRSLAEMVRSRSYFTNSDGFSELQAEGWDIV
ncbi:hypothetical protein ACWJJH_15745 [Endozoicomonadaceae bacterium StTr2]